MGSISGLELIETLSENNIVTEHPLELLIFANEVAELFMNPFRQKT